MPCNDEGAHGGNTDMQTRSQLRTKPLATDASRIAFPRHLDHFFRHGKLRFAFLATLVIAAVVYATDTSVQTGTQPVAAPSLMGAASSSDDSSQTKLLSQANNNVAADTDQNSSSGTSHASVVVNGQALPVPANGSLHEDLSNAAGNTSIDISHSSSVSGNSTSLNVQLNSSSTTSIGGSVSN